MNTIVRKTRNFASTYRTFLEFFPTQYFRVRLSTLGPKSGRFGIATFKMFPSVGVPFNPLEILTRPGEATSSCGS
jgi:hypothetical protein